MGKGGDISSGATNKNGIGGGGAGDGPGVASGKYTSYTAVSTKVVQKKRIHIARHLKSSLYCRGIMDSELLLKFIAWLLCLSALSCTLFWTTFVETAV